MVSQCHSVTESQCQCVSVSQCHSVTMSQRQGVTGHGASACAGASADIEDPYASLNDEGCGEEKLGRIQFSIGYNSRDMVLTLKVMRAAELAAKDFSGTSDPYVKIMLLLLSAELAAKDFSGTSDPYVKIMLLPDKKNKLQTNVKRKNLNPRWNETFAFEGFPYSKLITRTLYLQVFDYDRFSRDDPIGEVCLPLAEIDLSTVQTMWKTLQDLLTTAH